MVYLLVLNYLISRGDKFRTKVNSKIYKKKILM